MFIDKFNGRTCIAGFEGDDDIKIILEAVASLPLVNGVKYFIGYGRFFFIKQENTITTHCYRENWNGYHDCYKISNNQVDYRTIDPSPSQGIHRRSFVS